MEKPILHVIPKLASGGVEVAVVNLLTNSTQSQYELLVISNEKTFLYESLDSNIKQRITLCNGYVDAIYRIVKKRPNVLVSSLWKSHIVTVVANFTLKTKRYHFAHSDKPRHIFDKFFTRISILLTNNFISDSKTTAKALGLPKRSIAPMSLTFYNGAKRKIDKKLSFVFFGRLNKVKSLEHSILFIKNLVDMGYNPLFHIYGRDDGDFISLKNLVKSNN